MRNTCRPRIVRIACRPLELEIDLERSALIVIDMQNDFCHSRGWFGQKGIDVRPMRKPIAAIRTLLEAWRTQGGKIVWLNWGVRPDRLNLSPTQIFKSKYRAADGTASTGYAERSPDDVGRAVVPGEWGARVIDELPVASDDITVYKHRLSGFWDNEFDTVLRMHGVNTLLFAGVNTDRCVFSTLQDAGFIGYDCILLSDACSTPSPAYVSRAVHFLVQQLHGFVTTSRAVLDGLDLASLPIPPRSRS